MKNGMVVLIRWCQLGPDGVCICCWLGDPRQSFGAYEYGRKHPYDLIGFHGKTVKAIGADESCVSDQSKPVSAFTGFFMCNRHLGDEVSPALRALSFVSICSD